MEKASRFNFAVVSNNKRPPKTNVPQVTITSTKGNVKFNEAASRLLGLQHGDHAAFLNNEVELRQAIEAGEVPEDTPVAWAVMKGYTVIGADGVPKKAVKRLSKEEEAALIEAGEVDDEGNVLPQYEDKMMGFKLANNTKASGIGVVLTGSDATNYPLLGGNSDSNIVYNIEKEPMDMEVNGETVQFFVLGEKTVQAKRTSGSKASDADSEESED